MEQQHNRAAIREMLGWSCPKCGGTRFVRHKHKRECADRNCRGTRVRG